MKLTTVVGIALIAFAVPAQAWNARGHMVVAAVAWAKLTPTAKARATALLKLNPNYAKWTESAAPADHDVIAFMEAATWPDEIRSDQTYSDDGYTPASPTAGQITGYADKVLHRSWHFKDYPFSPDGTQTEEPFRINAETQIAAASDILGTSASDDAQSYSLAWLLHLVGDLHQPLHATSRFTAAIPRGDNGGNGVKVCLPAASLCDTQHSSALHSFWDGAVGTSNRPVSALALSARLPAAPATQAAQMSPSEWGLESLRMAKQAAYLNPVGSGKGPYRLTTSYRTVVGSSAERRIALAGTRLATLLNERFR